MLDHTEKESDDENEEKADEARLQELDRLADKVTQIRDSYRMQYGDMIDGSMDFARRYQVSTESEIRVAFHQEENRFNENMRKFEQTLESIKDAKDEIKRRRMARERDDDRNEE